MQNWKIVKAKKKDKWEKSKGKWKERVKRVAVVGMAVATLFSSLAVASGRLETTFADFSGDSDSGGGLIGGLSQGQKTSWNEQQIGIRFYLVDKNGARVKRIDFIYKVYLCFYDNNELLSLTFFLTFLLTFLLKTCFGYQKGFNVFFIFYQI